MKSLHLTNSWHESSGGMRTFYMELLKAANREEHLLRLVVPGEADRIEEVGEFGRIYHVRSPAAPFSPAYRMLYPHRFLLPGSILPRILHQEQPEVVEISEKYTLSYLGGMLRTRRLVANMRSVRIN